MTRYLPPANTAQDGNRYALTTAQRHAVWQNELAMFVVLLLPLVVASFWYGATVETTDGLGRVIQPALVSRGIGLALLITFSVVVGGALWLFVQPAEDRVRNAQPVRGYKRLAFAGFVGLLVAINTAQSLDDFNRGGSLQNYAIAIVLGLVAAAIAFVAMLSMVDIPTEPAPVPGATDYVRGAR